MTNEKIEKDTTPTEESTEVKVDGEATPKKPVEEAVDWKKIATDEQTKREKAEQLLAQKRFSERRQKKEENIFENDDDDEDNKPLTRAQIQELLQNERSQIIKETRSVQVEGIAKSLATSDDEASAIIAIFQNRTFPSDMPLEQQVRESFFIAHGPRLLAKQEELRRAVRSKETARQSSGENTYIDEKTGEPRLDPSTKQIIKQRGFAWDGNRYSKKAGTGKTLVYDHRTKKMFVEN